jgi:hypothetical protein
MVPRANATSAIAEEADTGDQQERTRDSDRSWAPLAAVLAAIGFASLAVFQAALATVLPGDTAAGVAPTRPLSFTSLRRVAARVSPSVVARFSAAVSVLAG